MTENSQIWTRLNDHGQRITKVEADIGHMAPRIHVTEIVGKLQEDMSSLRSVVEFSARTTEANVSKMASDMKEIMSRQGELNEEMMRSAAKAQQEKHDADMALAAERQKQAEQETARLRQAAEDARWHNRIKNYWLPALTLVTGGSVAAVTTWKVLEWFIRSMISQ